MLHWQLGGNFQPVKIICEVDWTECPFAILNYVWAEVVTDVVDCLTTEWMIWRVIAMVFACSILIHAIYSKTNLIRASQSTQKNLSLVGCKVQDLELKVNILTYKMQYGTWPLPRQIRDKTTFDTEMRNVKLTLNTNDRNSWLKHMLLSPSENNSCVPYAKIGPRSVRCLTKLINLETKYMSAKFSGENSSQKEKSSGSGSEKSLESGKIPEKPQIAKQLGGSEKLLIAPKDDKTKKSNFEKSSRSESQVTKYLGNGKIFGGNSPTKSRSRKISDTENSVKKSTSRKTCQDNPIEKSASRKISDTSLVKSIGRKMSFPIGSPEKRVEATNETLLRVREKLENLHDVLRIYGEPIAPGKSNGKSSQKMAEMILRDLRNLGDLPETESDEKTRESLKFILDSTSDDLTKNEEEEKSSSSDFDTFLKNRKSQDNSIKKVISSSRCLENSHNRESKITQNPDQKNQKNFDSDFGENSTSENASPKTGKILENNLKVLQNEEKRVFPTGKNVISSSEEEKTESEKQKSSSIIDVPDDVSGSESDGKSKMLLLRETLKFRSELLSRIESDNIKKSLPEVRNEESESDESFRSRGKFNFQPKLLDIISEEQSASSSTEKNIKKQEKEFSWGINENDKISEDTKSFLSVKSSQYFSLNDINEVQKRSEITENSSNRMKYENDKPEIFANHTKKFDATKSKCTKIETGRLEVKKLLQEEIKPEIIENSADDEISSKKSEIISSESREKIVDSSEPEVTEDTDRGFNEDSDELQRDLRKIVNRSVKNIRDYIEAFSKTQNEAILETRLAINDEDSRFPVRESSSVDSLTKFVNSVSSIVSEELPRKLSEPSIIRLVDLEIDESWNKEDDNETDFRLKRQAGEISLIEKINPELSYEDETSFESAEDSEFSRRSSNRKFAIDGTSETPEVVSESQEISSDTPEVASDLMIFEEREDDEKELDHDERASRIVDSPLTGRTVIQATSRLFNVEILASDSTDSFDPPETKNFVRSLSMVNLYTEEDSGSLQNEKPEDEDYEIVQETSSRYFTDEAVLPDVELIDKKFEVCGDDSKVASEENVTEPEVKSDNVTDKEKLEQNIESGFNEEENDLKTPDCRSENNETQEKKDGSQKSEMVTRIELDRKISARCSLSSPLQPRVSWTKRKSSQSLASSLDRLRKPERTEKPWRSLERPRESSKASKIQCQTPEKSSKSRRTGREPRKPKIDSPKTKIDPQTPNIVKSAKSASLLMKSASKSCIPILKSRLETIRTPGQEKRAKSPARCPLTMSTSSWSQGNRSPKKFSSCEILAEEKSQEESRKVDKINEPTEKMIDQSETMSSPEIDSIEKINDSSDKKESEKISECRTVIYVNVVTEQDRGSATRIVDPKKFLEYLKDRELKVQSVQDQTLTSQNMENNNCRMDNSPRVLTIVSGVEDDLGDKKSPTGSWSLRVERREIEVSAKPSVIDTSTSISDLPNISLQEGNSGDGKFQIFQIPEELTKDEYIVLLESLNLDPNLHKLRQMRNLCEKLGLGFHE